MPLLQRMLRRQRIAGMRYVRHETPASNVAHENAININHGVHRQIDLLHHTPTIAPTRTP